MPVTVSSAPDVLPAGAKRIWVGAFNGAYAGACKEEGERRDECASRIAWDAVKKKYKKSDDKWVAKSFTEMGFGSLMSQPDPPVGRASFIITKASASDGEMRWVARASDTLKDDLGTRMSRELFDSFIHYSTHGGPKPYLAVSHYGALNGEGVAGLCSDLWIDGIAFKAKGTFSDTSLGRALFGAIVKERNDPSVPRDQRIRLSIAFLDLMHSHNESIFTRKSLDDICPVCESGQLPSVFLDGVLIHLGATRVPINRRTSIKTEEMVQMGSRATTLLKDASSIVGGDLAARLDLLTREGHADEEDEEGLETQALVVKAGDPTAAEDPTKAEAQIQRSRRWGISVTVDGHQTIPLKERSGGATFSDYADPVNCKHLIWYSRSQSSLSPAMLKQVEGALVEFGALQDQYDVKSRGKIRARVEEVRSKFEIGKGSEERSYYVPEPVWMPWGGATTISEAIAFMEARDTAAELLNEVDLLEGVFRNILNSPGLEDKAAALKAVTEEFASRVGQETIESKGEVVMSKIDVKKGEVEEVDLTNTQQAPQEPAPKDPALVVKSGATTVSAPAPAPAPELSSIVSEAEVVMRPVVRAIGEFQGGVIEILGQTDLSTQDRLELIQPLLETMSGEIVKGAQAPPDESTQLVAAFSQALGAELRPLVEQIQLTLAQLSQSEGVGSARKTYSNVGMTKLVPPQEGAQKPSSIRAIARRSTGLSD